MERIIADQGVKSVNDAIDSMQNIDQLVTSLSTTITILGGRSNDIARILEVIKEVTEQTKLLSLNAQIRWRTIRIMTCRESSGSLMK
jgi:methyl-accepting chemotaxis protein